MNQEIRRRFVAATACLLADMPTAQQILEATKRMATGFQWSEHERKEIYIALCDRKCIPQNMR